MSLPPVLSDRLRLPLIGSPLFIISGPELVIAQCKAGIVGAFPSLNARPVAELDCWLSQIREELDAYDAVNPGAPSAPFAVNLIVHRSNDRLAEDLALCVKHRVPIVIISLGASPDINAAIHEYGGIVLQDVINDSFARKAIDKGADGLVLVAAGAGGHAGLLSPFAFVQETRAWFDGPIALAGAIASGGSILAALAMGADLAYAGSAFIAAAEARAAEAYKAAIVDGAAADIVYSSLFTGVHGNYLRSSIIAAGLDPDNLPKSNATRMNFGSGGDSNAKVWRDIWGCGQGIGAISHVTPAAAIIDRWAEEYQSALRCVLTRSDTLRTFAEAHGP